MSCEEKLALAIKCLEFYGREDDAGKRIVTVDGKSHWVKEYGCSCCVASYDVDDDGSIGCGNYELDDVRGMYAREVLAELKK